MEAHSPLKESPQRWWLSALLVSAMFFCYAHRGALSVAAPFMMNELHLSAAVMGILLSAFFWSYSLLQVPAGWLVDRLGARLAYAWGYALWSLASALTGLARGLPSLIFFRTLLGVGQSVAFPASARAVASWFNDRERGAVSAAYLTGVRLGQAAVTAAGASFLAAYGWKLFFLAIGVLAMVWLPPWLLFLEKWKKQDAPSSVAAQQKRASFLESLALMRHRSVLGIFLGYFAYDYAWFVYLTWLPGYLVLERKFSSKETGLYGSIPLLAMSVVILLSGFASDWFVRQRHSEIAVRKIFVAVGLVVACLIVPAGMVEDKMTAVWLLTGSLCGLGIASANTWTLTQAVCSKNIVGTVSGIQNFGGNIGGVIAPALTGYIAHSTQSFALALSITGGILVMGTLAYVLLVSRKVEMEGRGA